MRKFMHDMTTPVLLGDFKIDPVTQVLIRTTDNRSVKLSRSESLIICMLAEQPNVAVSRDTLLEACWTGKVVTNSSLTVAIKHIRSAFSELGAEDVIVTEPKKGYLIRFPSAESNLPEQAETPPAQDEIPAAISNPDSATPLLRMQVGKSNVLNLLPLITTLSKRYLVTAVAFFVTVLTLYQMTLFVESTRVDKHEILFDGQHMPPAIVEAIRAYPDPKAKMIAYPLGGICGKYQLIAIDQQSGFIDVTSTIEQGECHG
ncbi:winged helix-turn-helix domain-containing protein [Photobacterium sp. DA100]|uniref:winged helix-turn-helix domain-containing protein n=1 Tax=Photobacterium sp. DA100 TaxID=3027472 RepID=UPI00247AACF1|nr:winged helix-turn-helix domain-containing protein [Photobacterium sp. DA100]WEM43883.1 winged helix-turn-helix domain-containing protein [Photobacterium sp. DA100]